MDDGEAYVARLLAEVLRLQRWAGGSHGASAARAYGLANGFETVLRNEAEGWGVSEATQEAVENVLDDVDNGRQPTGSLSLKDRLRRDSISETDAARVMRLCLLESRFTDTIERIAKERGSVFATLTRQHQPESAWFGALHYVELIEPPDYTGREKPHAMFTPTVPRVGELVTPDHGHTMRVTSVEYRAVHDGQPGVEGLPILIPHVMLEPADDEELAQ